MWKCPQCQSYRDDGCTSCPACGRTAPLPGETPDVAVTTSPGPGLADAGIALDRQEEEAAETGGGFVLTPRAVMVERNWERFALKIGFVVGCVCTILFGNFAPVKRPQDDYLSACLCMSPFVGVLTGLFFTCAATVIVPAVHFFSRREDAEERALETAMDESDAIGRKWGEDPGLSSLPSDGGEAPGDGPPDENVQATR